MGIGRFVRRRGTRSAIALLVLAAAAVTGGCSGGQPQGRSHPAPGKTDASGVPNQGGHVPPAAGPGFHVAVVPLSPNRNLPASISVRSPVGHRAEIVAVRWFVNGSDVGERETLAPSEFRRGDRIRADVELMTDGGQLRLPTAEVVASNALPSVTAIRLEPLPPTSGSKVRCVVESLDPDGDPLTITYRWFVDGKPVSGEGDFLVLKGVRKGSWIHASATPNDGIADGAWMETSKYQLVNAPPVVTNAAPTEIPPSRVLTHTVVAEDPDGDPLTYTLVKGPDGCTLTGPTLRWKVEDADLDRTVEVVLRISDADGASTVLTMSLTPRKP